MSEHTKPHPSFGAVPRADWVAGVVLFFIGAAVFLPALRYDFVNWDDPGYLTTNSWLGPLSFERLAGPYLSPYYYNYHPLTITTFQLEYAVFKLSAPIHRGVNFLLHGGCVLLMYFLARLMGSARLPGFIICAFFAVHPLRIESVVWLSERKDVLCGVFYLGALVAWLKGNLAIGKGRRWHVLSLALFLLSLLSKAMAVSFPLVVLTADLLWRREDVRRRIPLYVFMSGVSALFCYLNWIAQESAIHEEQSLPLRLCVAAWTPLHYIATTLFPASLSPLYPRASCPALVPAAAIAGVAFCLAMVAITWSLRNRCKPLCFGLFSAALILAPVSGIVGFGYSYAADRYTYLPSAVLLAGAAASLSIVNRFDESRHRLVTMVALVLLLIYGGLAWMQLPAWRSSTSLWATALDLNPGDMLARSQLADAHSTRARQIWEAQGYTPQVHELLGKSLAARPSDPRGLIMLTSYLIASKQLDAAEAAIAEALADSNSRPISRSCALALSSVVARQRGNSALADKQAAEAFNYMPERSAELSLLARMAGDLGRPADAERYYRQILKSEPMHQLANEELAKLSARSGKLNP